MTLTKIKKRATSSQLLINRINLNKRYQKSNFEEWQYKIYKKIITKYLKKKNLSNIKILDVGSGDGLQVSYFLKLFKNVEIWSIDYSKKSLMSLRKKYKSKSIKTFKLDMDKLHNFIDKKNLINYFDIAHSSYALYYAKNQSRVLNSMRTSLKENGLFLISAPSEPHEMVNFINKYYNIPSKILKTLKFFKDVLTPYLKKNGKKFFFEKKVNYLNFDTTNEFMEFWKNTTYYNKKKANYVARKLDKKKYLVFKKISSVASAIKK